MVNYKLTCEIIEESLESLDYQLDRIKQQLRGGYTQGEGWDLQQINQK